jgi:hypothetical protein
MIVFDLTCQSGHRFEGWFGSSDDFARQQAKGMVCCPQCGSVEVAKAPMAPAVPRKGNSLPDMPASPASAAPVPIPPQVAQALQQMARMQAEALKSSTWVGGQFAEVSRAMHYGEQDQAVIHGEVSPEDARELLEEGVPVAPLLFPVAPPEELN